MKEHVQGHTAKQGFEPGLSDSSTLCVLTKPSSHVFKHLSQHYNEVHTPKLKSQVFKIS